MSTPGNTTAPILTHKQCARALLISERTLRRYVEEGVITPLRLGRTIRYHWDTVIAQLHRRSRVPDRITTHVLRVFHHSPTQPHGGLYGGQVR